MFVCPHCAESGVTVWGKFRASPISPTTCVSCGKSSTTYGFALGINAVIHYFALLIGCGVAFFLWSWVPLYVAAAVIVLAEAARVAYAPLKAMTDADIKRERRYGWLILGGILLLIIISGMVDFA